MSAKLTVERFIEESTLKHGGKYDYSLVTDVRDKSKVKIICPTHGVFEQRSDHHRRRGCGCRKCEDILTRTRLTYSTEEFIGLVNTQHLGKYTYPNTVYTGGETLVKIECPVHGEFTQIAAYHLQGHGCQKCGRLSLGEEYIAEVLDSLGVKYTREKRFTTCKSKRPLPFDFYLPEHSILIEFDGEQHYNPHKQFPNSNWETIHNNDVIKTNWALKQGYTLYRFRQISAVDSLTFLIP